MTELEKVTAERDALRADIVDALAMVGVTIESSVSTSGLIAIRAGMALVSARNEIADLRKQITGMKHAVGLLRAQLRVLGHIPCVVEDKATGEAELAFREAERNAKRQYGH